MAVPFREFLVKRNGCKSIRQDAAIAQTERSSLHQQVDRLSGFDIRGPSFKHLSHGQLYIGVDISSLRGQVNLITLESCRHNGLILEERRVVRIRAPRRAVRGSSTNITWRMVQRPRHDAGSMVEVVPSGGEDLPLVRGRRFGRKWLRDKPPEFCRPCLPRTFAARCLWGMRASRGHSRQHQATQ